MVRRWLSMLALALAASHAWLACADTQDGDDGLNPQPLPPDDSSERESPSSEEGSGGAGGGGETPGADDGSDGGDASVSDGSTGDG